MSEKLDWIFPERHPQDFQEGSDGNQKAFDGSIDSVLREAIQNSSDAKWPMYQDEKVKVRVTAIKLTGSEKDKYLKTIGWEKLKTHVEAVVDNKKGGANLLPQSLKDGLSKIRKGPLYLLRIEDFNTSGLFGYEKANADDESPNAFRAVHFAAGHSVNKLVGSGGSFGMGKYALMKGSLIQTVLYNSNINKEKGSFLPRSEDLSLESFTDGKFKNRFLGRTVLGTHQIDNIKYGKEGWFGASAVVETENSSGHINKNIIAQSEWTKDSFVKDLYLDRKEAGTSVLIVGYDPEKDFDNYDIDLSEIVEEMKRKIAINFWPAMSKKDSLYGGIEIEVGGIEDNKNTINYEVLKANNYVASHYSLYKLHEDALLDPINELSQKDELKAPKDTAARVINFSIPKTQSDLPERYKHDKTDHDVALLVKYVDPLTDNNINEELLNKVALIRGPGMVVKYEFGEKSTPGRGKVKNYNKDFIAIALVGAFAQDPLKEIDAEIAEKFFTHCEPPHHDRWEDSTDAFKAIYKRRSGAKTLFNENLDKLRDTVSGLLREEFEVTSNIPKEMKLMLTFPGEGSAKGEADKESKKFRINITTKDIEFDKNNGTYKIPVTLTAPNTISKNMSVKVGVSGDSVKANEKRSIPFQIPKASLGSAGKLIKNNVILVDHEKLNRKRQINFAFICKTGEVGIDPFSLGLSIDDPLVLEVH